MNALPDRRRRPRRRAIAIPIALPDGQETLIRVSQSAYDGQSLTIAYQIDGDWQSIAPYAPTEAEREAMRPIDTLPMAQARNADEQQLTDAFYAAFHAGGKAGIRCQRVSLREQFFTPDGLTLPMNTNEQYWNADGMEGRLQFVPLPEDARNLPSLSLVFDSVESWYWTEDGQLYEKTAQADSRAIAVAILRAETVSPQAVYTGQAGESALSAEIWPSYITLWSGDSDADYLLWNPQAQDWTPNALSKPMDGGRTLVFPALDSMPAELRIRGAGGEWTLLPAE